jgi:nitroimidazol reductase NimA-like FMN-containing flavoprotein (pyridoxamine 5'-phosphate oxidase superfamily)
VEPELAREPYCYITTTGRRTGNPHTVEIWFGAEGDTLYVLAGGRDRSDTVRNLRKDSALKVRIGSTTCSGRARILGAGTDEDVLARRLLLEKYAPGYSGSLDSWGRTSLPFAIDITGVISTDPGDALWPKGRRLG